MKVEPSYETKNPGHGGKIAVSYVRMSTDRQDYSTTHQRTAIAEFAVSRSIVVVREYVDEGKSGLLGAERRKGLAQLMADVKSERRDFSVILVYDVSRWGRFQDVDEAAFYEHSCRLHDVEVVYCAEQFNNDRSPLASLLKGIKRMMAAEYSRELSVKVFNAQCRLARFGFKQGGTAGYGLRRVSVSPDGVQRRTLNAGERKYAPTDRVVFVLGPANEVAVVQRVYSLYVRDQLGDAAIARVLNAEKIESEFGGLWSKHHIISLLTNVKYAGTLAFNRVSCKLSTRRKHNSSDAWVRCEQAFEGPVSVEQFEAALKERARRRATQEEMKVMLNAHYEKYGRITAKAINADRSMPDSRTITRAFGSLLNAYTAAGISKYEDCKFAVASRRGREIRRGTFLHACSLALRLKVFLDADPTAFMLRLSGGERVRVSALACRHSIRTFPFWMVKPHAGTEFHLIARMDIDNKDVLDYLIVPSMVLSAGHIYLRLTKPLPSACLRFATLEQAFGMTDPLVTAVPDPS